MTSAAGAERADFVAAFRRTVNLAGVFDRRDSQRGWAIRSRHLDAIVGAGFDGVRLPVRWWGHSTPTPPYAIDEQFIADVADLVDAATARGLAIVLTMHHADTVHDDPAGSSPRLAALWRQIARRFEGRGGRLAFELLNEPRMAAADWSTLLTGTLRAVREVDPGRVVVAGGVDANSVEGLRHLDLPADPNLIATVHYYEPFHFTHQGAFWEPGSSAWLGTGWGSPAEHDALDADLRTAAAWARHRGVPLLVGEFGSLSAADPASRIAWTARVRRTAEWLGLVWGYWDFATDFGIYDLTEDTWRTDLLASLFD